MAISNSNQLYQDYLNRKSSNTKGQALYADYQRHKANNIIGKINSLQNKVVSLGNQYNSRYFDANGQALPVTWRADSAQWLESVTPQWKANATEAASLAEELRGYKDYLDEDTYNAAMDAINVSAESNRTIFSRAKNENDAFSPFTSEKDYTLVSTWAGQDEAESLNTWNNLQKNLTYAYSQDDAEMIDEAVYAANLYADYYAGSGKKDSSVYYMTQEYQQNRRLQRLDEIDAEIENLEKESAAYSADTQKWLTNPQDANGVNPQNMSGQWDRNARIEQLKQERAQLEASANYYESHDQAYNRAMAVTGNADFGEIAMIQDLPQNQNPTREEMDAYDQSTAYAEVPEGTYVPAGQESQYSRQSTTAAAPEIKDPLGLYLSTSEAERAEAMDINSTTGGTWARAISKGADGRWDLMREDDVAAYYYILNTKGTKDAEKFLEDISTRLLQRENEAFTENLDKASTGELLAAAALSVFTKPFTSIIGGASLVASGAKGEYFDPNLNPLAQSTDAIREELSKRANVHKDNFIGNVLHAITGMEYGELLQTGFSFADSEMTRALFGPAASVVLGMDAARSAATQTYENGGSKGQIFATAFMAGLAETVSEYVSLEHFADEVLDGNYYRATELFKQGAIQGGVEASEEVFTEIANTISNGIIMGKMSDYNIAVQAYISEGYSEADAKKKATTDVLANIWSSAAGGFLSGGARTAIVGPVVLAKNQAAYGKRIKQSSEAIAKDKHSIDQLITVAENAKTMGNKFEQAKLDKQIAAVKADPSVANIKALENTTNKITRDYMIKTGNEALKMAETEKERQDAQETVDVAKSNPDFAGSLVMANQAAMKNKGTYSVGTGTTNKATGEDIKITGVHRTRENGKPSLVFQLEDGSTINASDVSYDSSNKAVVAETLADTGIRADYAMSLYNSVTDSMEGAYVAAGIQDAINAGKLGESFEVVKKGRFASDLTAAQLKTAYNAGKALGNDYYNKRKGLASQKTSRNLAVENENGKVVGKFYDGTEGVNLRETTKAQLDQVKMIAKAINANVEIYASSVVDGVRQFTDRRGVVHKGNAAYIPGTNTIVIDINAGDTLNGLVLNSMSHEVVHYIAEFAPDKFRKLADFVVGKFGDKGQSVTDLVRNKQSKYAAQGEKLTFMEAFEEVVADSVESMLSQKADKIAADIAEMRKVDADLAKTFVDKVKEIAKRILTVFKKNNFQSNPETVEGKFFAKWTEVQDELASIFAEGAAAAADTVATAAKQSDSTLTKENTPESSEVKNMYRGKLSDGTSVYETGFPSSVPMKERVALFKKHLATMFNEDLVELNTNVKKIVVKGDKFTTKKSLYPGKDVEPHNMDAMINSLFDMTRILSESKYVPRPKGKEIEPSYQNPNIRPKNPAHNGVKYWYVFENHIVLDGEPYLVWFNIRDKGKEQYEYEIAFKQESKATHQSYTVKQDLQPDGVSPYEQYYTMTEKESQEKISKSMLRIAEKDADYMKAVKAGDMKTAQKMVDEAAKAAGYDAGWYHGAKNGKTFTVFKGWQYFTKNKDYAMRYANHNEDNLYSSFVKMENPFDTRDPKCRAIFKQMRQAYGLSDLQSSGLPDWTDGYDIVDFIEENDLPYDGIVLDEGGDMVNGKPVSRGESYVIRSSDQIKSADPVTYDDQENVIPLSERFNTDNKDIRYSLRNVTERQTIMEMLDSLPYEVEHNQYFQEYRNKVKDIDRKQAMLDDLNEEWRELMFKKGKRSEETKARLAEIRTEADRLNKQITKLDSRLLELAEFRPFRNLVKAAEKKQKAADAKKMTEYRANVKLKEEKQKVLRILKDINSFLIANTKDHHVPAELRKQFAEALMAFDFGYSNSQKAKTYLNELADAYKAIANSENPLVASWYDNDIESAFEYAKDVVGQTNLYDMNEEQTKALHDLLKRMRHRIAKSNRFISENMKETATQAAYNSVEEIKSANNKERRTSDNDLLKYIEKRSFDDLKAIYFFSRIGSPTLQKMFQNILNGQYVYAATMREAGKWIADLNEKYGANKWERDQRFTFKDVAGESFQLTLGEIMDIYAHSRREQSRKHLLKHGIVTKEARIKTKEKNGRVKQEKYTDSANHPLSADVLAEILSDDNITKEQKEYVAALQDYLSDVMGQKGNEVSLAMNGVALYEEKHYWPIKTVSWYNAIDPQQKGVPSIASPNHSKAVNKYASSPIVVHDALETWNKHVHDMAMYYGLAIPVSEFTRVVNVKTLDNTTNVGGVRQALDQYCGPAAVQYISDLLNDLNGGVVYGSGDDLAEKMITLAKKSAVMLSLSVAIQQPSAIVRATMYIPPKYFLKKKEYNDLTVKGFYDRWEHLCDIAPIAQLKDMGGFDTGTGMSGQDYLRRQSETKLTDIIDDVTGFLPATMDKLTWLKIYDAAEAMVRDNNKGLSESEIQAKAVELFSNVIELTQVYDSVLTRPGTMRKKDSLAKMMTSFAAEPMVSINMVNDAITKVIRNEPGARKNLAKALGVVVSAALVNALLKSLVTAWRDDDEDEMLYEKYLSAVLGNFLSDALVYTNLPMVRDVVSAFEGYSTERMDMTVISDIINAWGKVINNGTDWNEVLDAVFTTTSLTPIPLKNVWKDVKGGINFVKGLGRDIRGENTPTGTGFTQAVRDGIPILAEDNNSEALYKAYLSGNSKDIQQFRANFKTETAADTAVKSELRKRDKRVLEAAILRYNGNVNGSAELVAKIAKDTNIPEDLVQEAVMAEMEKYRKKQKGDTEEEYNGEVSDTKSTGASQYTLTDLKLALEQGRPTEDIIDKIIADKVAGGVTKKQATSQVKTSVLSTYKPLYYDAYVKGDKAEMERIKKLLVGTDLWNATELNNIFKNYIKNKEDE